MTKKKRLSRKDPDSHRSAEAEGSRIPERDAVDLIVYGGYEAESLPVEDLDQETASEGIESADDFERRMAREGRQARRYERWKLGRFMKVVSVFWLVFVFAVTVLEYIPSVPSLSDAKFIALTATTAGTILGMLHTVVKYYFNENDHM